MLTQVNSHTASIVMELIKTRTNSNICKSNARKYISCQFSSSHAFAHPIYQCTHTVDTFAKYVGSFERLSRMLTVPRNERMLFCLKTVMIVKYNVSKKIVIYGAIPMPHSVHSSRIRTQAQNGALHTNINYLNANTRSHTQRPVSTRLHRSNALIRIQIALHFECEHKTSI